MKNPNIEANSKYGEYIVVRYKFKYEDKVIVKVVSMDIFQELKNASTIEYCEIMN